jgi:hypothetical protein
MGISKQLAQVVVISRLLIKGIVRFLCQEEHSQWGGPPLFIRSDYAIRNKMTNLDRMTELPIFKKLLQE